MIKLKDILREMGALIDAHPTTDDIAVTIKISKFLESLSTSDDGQKEFENYIVKFRGFSDEGGLNTSHEGKTINQLEDEMLDEWQSDIEKQHPNEKVELKEANWTGNVFYAIYILGGIGSLNEVIGELTGEEVPEKVYNFLDDLTTDDIGEEQFNNFVVKFEGFTDECWYDVDEQGKCTESLETEMIDQWYEELQKKYANKDIELVDSNWAGMDGNIFYAVYKINELEGINEVNKSTLAVRRFYRRHPGRVRKYLKKTQDDRVARNRDRRKAVKKHGKAYMRNKDVHHPKGPSGGKTRIVKKDHGPDKKKK